MKRDKQIRVLALLASGRYKVVNGVVYGPYAKPIKGTKLPSQYTQYCLFDYFSNKVVVYKHILIYLSINGEYPEGYEIDHIDRDNQNDNIDNLRAVNPSVNNANQVNTRCKGVGCKRITSDEIKQIRMLISEGLSQSAIAKQLGLKRLTARYAIKKILANEPLKYEKD